MTGTMEACDGVPPLGMVHGLQGGVGSLARALGRLCDEVLRGYGQVFFCASRRSGLLVMLATVTCPRLGLCALLGAVMAVCTSRALPPREVLSSQGLYACNGALAGLSVAAFAPASLFAECGAVAAGALAAVLLLAWSGVLSAARLPGLSMPFVCAAWVVLSLVRFLDARLLPLADMPDAEVTAAALAAPVLVDAGPLQAWAGRVLAVLAATVLSPGLLAGALCLLAGFVESTRRGAMMAAAALAGLLLVDACPPPGGASLVAAVNVFLAVVALACVFLPAGRTALVAAAVGGAGSLAILQGLAPILEASHLPPLVAPFNLATLGVLYWFRRAPRAGDEGAAPGGVEAPSRAGSLEGLLPSVPSLSPWLRLPFCGAWMVSQGPGGLPTHQGEGWHAWDFVVVDEDGRTHRDGGLHVADYHAFGLPVLAPAAGTVVRVVDGVRDNPPSQDNPDANWGNLVIIDHGHGICTEISHFQQGSVGVREGQEVAQGQLLGRCGSSGRSLEPHIHLQVQVSATLGAPTLPARFLPFRIRGLAGASLSTGSPREGEVVENDATL